MSPNPPRARRAAPRRVSIEIANRQSCLRVQPREMKRVVREVLAAEGVQTAQLDLAIVDDHAIRELHRQFLGSDTATDVLTFPAGESESLVAGEIVVSAETACREGPRHRLHPTTELLLYVIHGILHLCGYDDRRPGDRRRMSRRQMELLQRSGSVPTQSCPAKKH